MVNKIKISGEWRDKTKNHPLLAKMLFFEWHDTGNTMRKYAKKARLSLGSWENAMNMGVTMISWAPIHMFISLMNCFLYPLLFWSALGVQATRPVYLEGVCDAIAAPTMHLPVPVRHSLTLLVLWVVWKSRNRKVFDNVPSSPRQLSSMIHTHYNLWVHRLSSKTPRHGADAWCSRVCDALNSLA
jgi:hypothetical protein